MGNVNQAPSLEMALEFGLDFSRKANGAVDHIEAIKEAIRMNIGNIVREECTDDTFVFVDGSTATWYGSGWTLGKKAPKPSPNQFFAND